MGLPAPKQPLLFEPAVRVNRGLIPRYVVEYGLLKMGACQVGAGEVGAKEGGARETRESEVGACEVGADARFRNVYGVAVDGDGNVYAGDEYSGTVRKVTPGGVVTRLAGSGSEMSWGFQDGIGPLARFSGPTGVAVDGDGNVYVADSYNNVIRKVTPAG